jgi:hypothetical protein
MKYRWLPTVGCAATLCAFSLAGCSDDNETTGNEGGSSMGGSKAGTSTGASSSGGSANGGKPSGGSANGGSATAGTGTGGTSSAGTSGGGAAGSTTGGSATGGTAVGGSSMGGASDGGAGGEGGEPGTVDEVMLFDFETDIQGWKSDDASILFATSEAQFVTGKQSLKVTMPAIGNDKNSLIGVDSPPLWPGAAVKLHVWVPAGDDALYIQGFTLSNSWKKFDADGNARPINVNRGGWTDIEYTVPNTFPGGLQRLGIQVGVGATGTPFAGGDIYLDSITYTGGVAKCEGAGAGSFGFEADAEPWKLDAPHADTAVSQSTDKAKAGTGSMKIALTDLPATTDRIVRIEAPNVYCSQEVTVNVWTPLGSDGVTVQVFAQANNWASFFASPVPTTTRGDWTQIKYTIPAVDENGKPAVGPAGMQALGLLIKNTTNAAFSGNIYVDDVSW